MSALKTLIANVKHAARSRETVTIGGGEFTPAELKEAVAQYDAMTTELGDDYSEERHRHFTRPLTNVELVTEMMEFSKHGALAQVFIMEAITKYAEAVAQARPEDVDTPFMSGQAWVSVAQDIKRQIEARA